MRVRLAPGAEAAEPYEVSRRGRTQIVVDVSRRRVPRSSTVASARSPLRLSRPDEGFKIVIDPGHGGHDDPGAVGASGLKEKDVVLDLARRLSASSRAACAFASSSLATKALRSRTTRAPRSPPEPRRPVFIVHLNSYPRPGRHRLPRPTFST